MKETVEKTSMGADAIEYTAAFWDKLARYVVVRARSGLKQSLKQSLCVSSVCVCAPPPAVRR